LAALDGTAGWGHPRTREGLVHIATTARGAGKAAFIFVNNRLEGNAPTTIEAVAQSLLN
jgi:hypothetical protein